MPATLDYDLICAIIRSGVDACSYANNRQFVNINTSRFNQLNND